MEVPRSSSCSATGSRGSNGCCSDIARTLKQKEIGVKETPMHALAQRP